MVVVLRLQSTHRRFASTSVVTFEKNLHQMLAQAVGSGGAERRRRSTARALNAKLHKVFRQDGKHFTLTRVGYELRIRFSPET